MFVRSWCRALCKRNVCNLQLQVNGRHLHNRNRVLNSVVSFKLSDIGEGIRDVVVKEWYVKVGDTVSQFDNICEVQSDKASVTITSRYDGVIKKVHYDIDDTALVGQPLVDIETEDDADHTSGAEKEMQDVPPSPIQQSEQRTATNDDDYKLCIPSVRRLAKENKLNLLEIKGTGKNGRILKEDVLKFLEKGKPEVIVTNDEIKPLSPFQKAMLKTMTESLRIPDFVYSEEIYVTKLTEVRKVVTQAANLKLSYMPFFIKATSNALLKYPILNSSFDENYDNVIHKKSHNIGVAMDTKIGLAVPVIKNVQNLNITEIGQELKRLMVTGKEGTFSNEDLAGGTFSISNIGVIGGTYTKPVILPPQVGIIAIGRTKVVPTFDSSGNLKPEEVVYMSAAADHRLIDGATMANFITAIKKQIENPYLLFLNVY